jgi:hypothetical protein
MEMVDVEVDGVETVLDEACTEFARPRNASWMNAHTGVANTGRTKVGTTMNICYYLRGPAQKVSETVAVRIAGRRENVVVAHCCRSRVGGRDCNSGDVID